MGDHFSHLIPHLADSLILIDQAKDVLNILTTLLPCVNKGSDLDIFGNIIDASTHLLHELRGVVEKEGMEVGICDEGRQQVVVHQS